MKNPLIPMGAMTGDLTTDDIREMLVRYKENGIEQFLVYPRDGCEVPYMSERWLSICEDCVKIAAELGMDIWLYDEYNWPSGTCNREVMRRNEDFYSHFIDVDENGNVSIKKTERYSDMLNPDAVELFIELTHEVYYKRLGKYFGSTVKGIFTDEPSVAYYSYENKYIYYKNMEKDYRDFTGRDLFSDVKAPDSDFDFAYNTIVAERFRNSFAKRISEWCREHGILMTGHLFDEFDVVRSVRSNGNTLKVLREFSLPGIDEIFTRTSISDAEWLTFGTAQAAIRSKGNGGLVETFALGPTDIVPARVEQMIWLEAMFGIDRFVLAVSAFDARGNVRKSNWFNPMNYMNPWFCGYTELGASAKEAAELARKEIKADVAVRLPYGDVYRTMYREPSYAEKISANLKALLAELTRNQYQWIITDEDEEIGLPEITFTDMDFDAPCAVRDFSEKHPRKTVVTDEDGNLPDNIFFREYTDGSAVVIDLSDSENERKLVLSDTETGAKTPFSLGGRGHIVIPSCRDFVPSDAGTVISEISPEFEITLDRPNTLRANFRTDRTEFTFLADERLEDIRLLLRNYMPGGDVFFDGKKVNAHLPSVSLTHGMSELYLSSEPFTLCEGEHVITVSEAAKGESYLPSCFVAGEFADEVKEGKDTLSKLPKKTGIGRLDTKIIPQYAGKITYEAKIAIPKEASIIRLSSSELYTRVYLDGEYLGGKISGYEWQIPGGNTGAEVSLKIEQFTSIGPIFGRRDDVVIPDRSSSWAPLYEYFPQKYEKSGIENIKFIKKGEQ